MEPDRWFGHAFGQALRAALEADAPRLPAASGRPDVVSGPTGRAPAVVLLHLYYPDLIEEFADRLAALDGLADIAITFPDTWTPDELARLAAAFPRARLAPTPNVGRDIAPFIAALGWARQAGYPLFCKLHSKRSPHLAQGDAWREALLSPLLGAPAAAVAQLQANADVGLLAAGATRTRLGTHGVMHNNAGGWPCSPAGWASPMATTRSFRRGRCSGAGRRRSGP
ncbi:rhamnan synthesis F family protein [Caulobacter sp. B11]|uniref:rhamnan synthesis F family protein n=1 Tax=Caulobacter sp. B11 TaxID=2048899 RepID=UPI001F1D2DDC|nr:rhamnan synthesis F family protein [Caulobacter sp. B11]